MHRIIFALTFAIIASFIALARQATAPTSSDPKARAQEVLKQARAAIWDETKSKPLQSLTINAMSRGKQTGEITLEALLPDKFLQTSSRYLGAAEFISMLTINGTRTWSDFKQPDMGALVEAKSAMGSGSAKADDYGGKKDITGGGSSGGAMPQISQEDFGRMLLAWLLITPGTLPVEFTYAGEAKADGKTADVLDAQGPNDRFATRLFIAQQTHQLLMLTYQAPMPNTADKMEIRWVVSDYRNVNGLTLPHHLTKSTGGVMTGEIEINKVKVNPSLKPEKFEKKGK